MCYPDTAPGSAICGTVDRQFSANGRVWITRNGSIVIGANHDWTTTQTLERSRSLTAEYSLSPSFLITDSREASTTSTQSVSKTFSLSAEEKSPRFVYWTQRGVAGVYVAEINNTTGVAGLKRLISNTLMPYGLYVDTVNNKFWGCTR